MYYERIKYLREDNDFTQQKVADLLNITRSSYSNYENGLRNVPIELLFSLAELYGTSIDYIVGRTDKR